jgi:hypothetical protein
VLPKPINPEKLLEKLKNKAESCFVPVLQANLFRSWLFTVSPY